MREEEVTKKILVFLNDEKWKILSFDFPQSGTGMCFHPDYSTEKNKGSVIPDIIAQKGNIAVFFENKDRLVLSDFVKQKNFSSELYVHTLDEFCIKNNITNRYFGIGIPYKPSDDNSISNNEHLIDFVVQVNEHNIIIKYDKYGLFKNSQI